MRLGELSVLFIMAALTIMSLFIGAGTYAYYSGGPFTIDFSSPETIKPVISDLNPGDTVHIIIKVQNPYGRAAMAQIKMKNVICSENGIVEPEREWYDLYGVRNNLDEAIRFGLWIDRDGDISSCSDRDEWVIDEDENRRLADLKDKPIYVGKIPSGSSIILVSSYHMEEETENWAQSDSVTFDVELTLTVPSTPSIPTERSRFELRSLTIKPETVYVGDEVEISVEVSNVGSAKGTRTILLLTNGSRADAATVSLEAGESRTVFFELAKAKAGKYIVQVDGLSGSFTVLEKSSPPPKPAEFVVRGLTISPSEVFVGEEVVVWTEVVNVGESAGNRTVNLTINGTVESSETVTLDPEESIKVLFTVAMDTPGVYIVEVDGLRGSFTAVTPPPELKPAEFEVSDLSISPEEVGSGGTVTVSATVTNVGDLEGSCNVTLRVDGAVEAVETVTLAGGESTGVSFKVSRTDTGNYSVTVDGLKGVFTVIASPPPSPVPALAAGAAIVALSVIGAIVLWRRRSILKEESY